MADQLFTTWPMLATGAASTSTRTMPDRLADVINVKDFGAKGDISTDDTAAFQAAIDWTVAQGARGIIFIPPGVYKISGTLNLPGPQTGQRQRETSILFKGTGMGSELRITNFNGYIFQRLAFDTVGGVYEGRGYIFAFEDFYIRGVQNSTVSGFKIQGCNSVTISRVMMSNLFNPIYIGVSNFCVSIRDLKIWGQTPPQVNSIGILNGSLNSERVGGAGASSGVEIKNVRITNYWEGQRHSGAALIENCQVEESNTGYHIGVTPDGFQFGCFIAMYGAFSEACDVGIDIQQMSGVIDGFTATSNAGDSAGVATVSIAAIRAQSMENVHWRNFTCAGPYSAGAIQVTNIGSQGNWKFVKFERCIARNQIANFTASVSNPVSTAPSVLTITAVSAGPYDIPPAVGDHIGGSLSGLPDGVYIASKTSGAADGTGVYNLSGKVSNVSSRSMTGGKAWPTLSAGYRAAVTYEDCNNPADLIDFYDVPGPAQNVGYAVEGMERNIRNGQKIGSPGPPSEIVAGWNDEVTTGGTGHYKIRYDGSVWRRIG